jgi:hypothetical protein
MTDSESQTKQPVEQPLPGMTLSLTYDQIKELQDSLFRGAATGVKAEGGGGGGCGSLIVCGCSAK